MKAGLSVCLLGALRVRRAGKTITLPSKKSQALLAYVALAPGQIHLREQAAALLWGDRGEAQARHSLRQALTDLRKALGGPRSDVVRVEAREIALSAAVQVDVTTFETLVAEGTPNALGRAMELYRGDLLEGLHLREPAWEDWLSAERHRLRELRIAALRKLLDYQTDSGSIEAAIQTAGRLLAVDPLQEAVHRVLMRLYLRQGRPGAALKQYHVCVEALRAELGVEPEPETKGAYHDIVRARSEAARSSASGGIRLQHRPATPLARRYEPPLVGREPDLEVLRRALAGVVRGQGAVVVVSGEAGIGKTRLIDDAAGVAQHQGIRLITGRSYDMTRALAFGPWVDALRAAASLVDWAAVPSPALWRTDLAGLLPELAARGTTALRPAANPLRLFEAVASLLHTLSARRPVMLVLEDLHWADEMSLRLLSFMARALAASPVLIIATFREEDAPDAPLLSRTLEELERLPHFVHRRLARLSEEDTRRLIRHLGKAARLKDGGQRLDERVWSVTEGNPFMIVETIRAVVEAKRVDPVGALPLPARVRQLVVGRLARLSPAARDLAAVAAVIGREFDFHLLRRAADVLERDAADGLEELARYRVLEASGDVFRFSHDRIREVAYTELLAPRRVLLHAAVARALEDIHARDTEPHDAALGTHYFKGEVWLKAAAHLARAGHRAAQWWAWNEAIERFKESLTALEQLPRTPETLRLGVDVRAGLANQLMWLGFDDEGVARYLREAEASVGALGDPSQTVRILNIRAHYLHLTGDYQGAREVAHQALSIAEQIGDPIRLIAIKIALGHIYYWLGDYRRSLAFLEENIGQLDGDRRHLRLATGLPAVMCRGWAVRCLTELGEFSAGIALAREALRIADEEDHPAGRTTIVLAMGTLFRSKGDLDEAISTLESAMEQSRAWNLEPNYSHSAAHNLATAYALSGRLVEAVPLAERAIEKFIARRHVPPLASLAEVYLLAGRVDEAAEWAARSLAASRRQGDRGTEARTLHLLGEIAAHPGRSDASEALGFYRAAIAQAVELGMKPLAARGRRGLGVLLRRFGHAADARAELRAAASEFEAMDMRSHLQRAQAELADVR